MNRINTIHNIYKRMLFVLFFISYLFIFLSYLYSAVNITTLEVKRKDSTYVSNSQKTDTLTPGVRVGVVDSAAGLKRNFHKFQKTSDFAFLWSFNDSDPSGMGVIEESPNVSYTLSSIKSATQTITSSNLVPGTDFNKSVSFAGAFLQNSSILQQELTKFTIELWIKPTSNITSTSPMQYLIDKDMMDADNKQPLSVFFQNGKLVWVNYNTSNQSLSTVKSSWSQNKWHYIALVCDTNSKKIYVNGKLENQVATSGKMIANTRPFSLGGKDLSSGNNFKGCIDEVRISNTVALSEEQIFANYFAGGYRYSNDGGSTWTASWNNGNIIFPVTYSDGTKTAQTLEINSLNFLSSYDKNKIEVLVSNTLNEYMIKQFDVIVDTIPPNVVTDLVVVESTESQKIKVSWTAPFDLPDNPATIGNEKVISYEIKYATFGLSGLPIESWASLGTNVANVPAAANPGVLQSLILTLENVETTYYFTIRSYDGINFSSFCNLKAGMTGGLKAPTNFAGVSQKVGEILWTWTDNSNREVEIGIYENGKTDPIFSTTISTTQYLEQGIEEGKNYTRYVQYKDLDGNISTSTAVTVIGFIKYKKDIDDDGVEETFIDGKLNSSSSTLVVADLIQGTVFFDMTGDTKPDRVWILNAKHVTTTTCHNVNGNLTEDYLYRSTEQYKVSQGGANIVYDRFYDNDKDCHIGMIKGHISDKYGRGVSGVEVKIIADSSATVTGFSETGGNYSIVLPITHGLPFIVQMIDEGYVCYQSTQYFKNGEQRIINVPFIPSNISFTKNDIHNYPNPFEKGKTTKFVYNVRNSDNVKIYICNRRGIIIKKLLTNYKN
ncbi:LamG-like jellyroll fold domain-containing protein, partial [bacterium]